MSIHKPTEEQAAIVTAARSGAHLVVEAGAGTGKTSTLKLLAKAKPNSKGVYLAYNRSIAADAARSFPTTVVCKTAHSFAFAAVGRDYAHRLNAPRLPARETARLLGLTGRLELGSDVPVLAPQQVARIVMATVERFCQSADDKIVGRHVPLVLKFEKPAARTALAQEIVPLARKAWEDITNLRGRLRFTHDCYLKLWQLSGPNLRADYVLLDEAQDSNPAVADVVSRQQAQRILVGDRCQAIYGWRGAVDAMKNFDGQRLYLSQSFRFGQPIADEANKWLAILDAKLRLRGFDARYSAVGRVATPDAILCRSNGGALGHVFNAVAGGKQAALVGGGDEMRRYAEAAQKLMRREPCDHPELGLFTSWAEVQDYVEQDAGGSDLKTVVSLIDKHGCDAIIRITQQLVPEDRADVVISTAHKSKGREWDRVLVADDFVEPKPDPETGEVRLRDEEAMLAYVTVTRAQHLLDRSGLAWVDDYVPRPFGALLEASSLGAPDAVEAREQVAATAQASLTGMPEEQADWDADEPVLEQPAAPSCRCLQTAASHSFLCPQWDPASWPAPVPVGARP